MRHVGVMLAVALIVACATSTEITKVYQSVERPAAGYSNILVIGVAGDRVLRQRVENAIVADLRQAGVKAFPSHETMKAAAEISRERILDSVAEVSSDAVLVIRVLRVETDFSQSKGRVDVKATCRRGDPHEYFLYDYEELKQPDSVRLAQTVVLASDLYNSEDGARIWAIQSTCFEKETLDDALREQSLAIVGQLEEDRIIS